MSNSILNYHILDGQPAGDGADLYEIADYYGDLLFEIRPLVTNDKSAKLLQSDRQIKSNQESGRNKNEN